MREFAPGALVSLHSHNSNDRAGNRRDAGKDKQCQVHSFLCGVFVTALWPYAAVPTKVAMAVTNTATPTAGAPFKSKNAPISRNVIASKVAQANPAMRK